MNLGQDCLNCVKARYLKYAKLHDEIIDKEQFIKECDESIPTIEAAIEADTAWEKVAKRYVKSFDAFAAEKEAFQEKVLSLKDDIEKLLDNSDNLLADAVKFAIAGNVIDFGTMPNLTLEQLEEVIADVKNMEINPELFAVFLEELKAAKNVVLLLDNVGEVVLDAILCKKIKELYPDKHITVIPASYPVSSDVTPKEAYEAGMADYADIVPSGNDICGTLFEKCSDECIKVLEESDIILSKGLANFETCCGSKYNIYYFFLAKCRPILEPLGKEFLDPVFISDKHNKDITDKVLVRWKEMGR